MTTAQTHAHKLNGTYKVNPYNQKGQRPRIVNGEMVADDSGLISVAEAYRRLGVYVGGVARQRMRKYGIPIVGLGGINGGTFLVRAADVERVRLEREARQAKIAAVVAAATPTPTVPAAKKVAPPVNDEVLIRLQTLERKLDKLLAVWDATDEAS